MFEQHRHCIVRVILYRAQCSNSGGNDRVPTFNNRSHYFIMFKSDISMIVVVSSWSIECQKNLDMRKCYGQRNESEFWM